MALSRRAKLAIGGGVFVGAAVFTTTGVAFAATEPSLRITETVDDGGRTGVADDGGCDRGGGAGAASEQ